MKPEDIKIGDRISIIPVIQVKKYRKEQIRLDIHGISPINVLLGVYSRNKGTVIDINGYVSKKPKSVNYNTTFRIKLDNLKIKERTNSDTVNAYADEIKLIEKQLKLYKSILKIN